MWWFRALRANLLTMFKGEAPGFRGDTPDTILDAGCGTGGLLLFLSRALPDRDAMGIDADAEACAVARRKSGRPVAAGSVNALPVADGRLAAIFSADVLCHAGVNEAASLADFHRCLMPGGVLILNLPAYRWLMSAHDRAVHNARRYTGAEACRLLRGAGFEIVRTSYWNSFLFPLMVVRRLLPVGTSDVRPYPPVVEAAFGFLTRMETMLLDAGFRLPFGGSLLAVAVKP